MDREKLESVTQVPPYEGNEDYIFISYSHRDTATVLPLLQRMKAEGYRFWYDEGIDPGSEWPESIAAHLGRCRVCLAFMSSTSLASQNCRREINFALSKNKEFLSVILEPVEMSPGMEMQISTYQSILKYKYYREEQFLSRLLNLELLKSCREPRAVPVEAATQPAAAPASAAPVSAASAPTTPAPAAYTPPAPAAFPSASPVPPVGQVWPAPQGVRPAGPKAAPAGLKKWLPIAIAVAAVLLVVIIAAAAISMGGGGSGFGNRLTIGDKVYQDNVTLQRVTGADLSAKQLQALGAFEKCTMLYLTDCTLESGTLDALSAMEQLSVLSLENCQGVGDLSFLNELPKLYSLNVTGCGLTDEQLAGFRGEHLTKLNLSGNALNTVPVLSAPAQVTDLSLAGNGVGDVTALSAWTGLVSLDVSGCGLTSLSGLEGHQGIKKLYAADNQVTDLTPLSELIYLSTLDLKNNRVTSLEPLSYCWQLSVVSLRNNPDCTGLDILSGSKTVLTKLDVSGIAAVTSLDFLSGCGSLTQLYAEDCNLNSCFGLSDCSALEQLSLARNQISDISDLAGLTSVAYLNLADNEIYALPDLERLGADATYSRYVFSNNKLVNLGRLPSLNYYGLMVDGNPLNDLSAVGAMKGTYLVFDCTEITPLGPLEDTGFSTIYATSVFIGKQAELESSAGYRGQITFEEAFAKVTEFGDYASPDF